MFFMIPCRQTSSRPFLAFLCLNQLLSICDCLVGALLSLQSACGTSELHLVLWYSHCQLSFNRKNVIMLNFAYTALGTDALKKVMWTRRIYLRLSNSIFFNADNFINTLPIDQNARLIWHLCWLKHILSPLSAQAGSLPPLWLSLLTANSVLSIILLLIS